MERGLFYHLSLWLWLSREWRVPALGQSGLKAASAPGGEGTPAFSSKALITSFSGTGFIGNQLTQCGMLGEKRRDKSRAGEGAGRESIA
jgi:hypothetical protein